MSFQFKSQLPQAKTRANERAEAALAKMPSTAASPMEAVPILSEYNQLINDVEKSLKELKEIHVKWNTAIAQIQASDATKANEEQQKLDDETDKADGFSKLYEKLNEAKDHLANNINEVFASLQQAQNTSSSTPQENNGSQPPSTEAASSSNGQDTQLFQPTQPQTVTFTKYLQQPEMNQTSFPSQFNLIPQSSNVPNCNQPSMTQSIMGGNMFQSIPQPTSTASFTSTFNAPPAPHFPPPTYAQPNFLNYSLPKLQLPKFDGNFKTFRHFWQMFAPIHNNPSMSNIEKLALLISHLTGQAKRVFERYDICEVNYMPVVNELFAKYGQTEKVIDALCTDYYAIKPRSETLNDTMQMVYDMESLLNQLQALSVNMEEQGLKNIYRGNLPEWLLLRINSTGIPTSFAELRQKAQFQLQVAEASAKAPIIRNRQQTYPVISKYEKSHSNDTTRKEKDKLACIFCGKHKYSSICKTVSSVSERQKIAAEKKLCFRCLKPDHISSKCPEKKPCSNCKGDHHATFCFHQNNAKPKSVHSIKVNEQPTENVAMMVVPSPISNPHNLDVEKNANLFMDSGAASCFISTELAHQLKLPVIVEETLELQRFGENGESNSMQISSQKVSLLIKDKEGHYNKIMAYTIDQLTDVLPVVDSESMNSKWVLPDVLIGNDYFWEFFPTKKLSNGYSAVSSKLGTIICGKKIGINAIMPKVMFQEEKDDSLLQNHWEIERIGTQDCPYDTEDSKAIEKYIHDTEIVDGRIQVRFPFRMSNPTFKPNEAMSYKCLQSLLLKLAKTPDIAKLYDELIRQQEATNVIEKAPKAPSGKMISVMPHHAVITPHKSTKLRIVYNCSAKTSKKELSFNDCLYTGPSLIPEMAALLLRLRTKKILISADVEKAFLQLSLHPDDRDYVRFYWVKNLEKALSKGLTSDNIQEYRFARLLFGCKASPFLLNASNQKLFQQVENPEFAEELKRNTYVDNVFLMASENSEGLQKIQEAIDLFMTVKMNLRDVISNSPEIRKHFNCEAKTCSVLGLEWDAEKDVMTINMPTNSIQDQTITKRMVMAEIGAKYDPHGILAPVTLRMKIFMQDLWKRNLKWDEALSPEECATWKQLIEETMKISYPRFLKAPEGTNSKELYVFSDASGKAYAAVAFIVFKNNEKVLSAELLMSKTKVAPTKAVTIPRLELLSVTLGIRIQNFIKENMGIEFNKTIVCTDSSAVFFWINSTKQLQRFVQNRVDVIKAANVEIRYVPTKSNPADIASRGTSMKLLLDHELWWKGPFAQFNENSKWPLLQAKKEAEVEPEVTKELIFAVKVNNKAVTEKMITVKNGSSWQKLVRMMSYCLTFIKLCKKEATPNPRSCKAYIEAERFLIKNLQESHPPDESTCRSLLLFKDDKGLLRSQSRLEKTKRQELANPIWLPCCPEINLLIISTHKICLHANPRHVLTELRQQFQITRGLQTVKKAIKECRDCVRFKAKPYELPKMPQLPGTRVIQHIPFQHSGVDLAGPFTLKGKEAGKAWIVLFTCLTTRAVYLDMVTEVSAEAFINALRRFTNLYGSPQSIMSDNGSNFKAVGVHIAPLWCSKISDPDLMDYVTSQKITWRFITERAPWKGGIYERLIGCMKSSLKHGIGRKKLNEEEFITLLREVQGILNSRPLTDVEGDIKALRPIDFMLPNACLGTPRFIEDDSEDDDPSYFDKKGTKEILIEKIQKSTKCLQQVWNRWHKEYLTQLRETSQHFHRQRGIEKQPEIDEVVLIHDELVPRGNWKLGKITEVKKGDDGEIRTATVKTANGNMLNRSPAHLYPLEANLEPNKSQIPRKSKSPVNTVFFFLTLLQLFMISCASSPIINELYCSTGFIYSNATNVSKLTMHLPHRTKLMKINETITVIPLPPDVLSAHAKIEMKFWSDSGESKTEEVECEHQETCELIKCSFCKDAFTHPHCWSIFPWLIMFAAITVVGILCVRRTNWSTAPYFVKGGRWCLRFLQKRTPKKINNQEALKEIEAPANWKPSADLIRKNALLLAIILIFAIVQEPVNACSNSNIIQASSESCIQGVDNQIRCNFTTKSSMALTTGTEACLLLQSSDNVPTGTIKFSVKAFAACEKWTKTTTRFVDVKVKSEKRCPGAGSCTNNQCAEIAHQTKIPELGIANDYPGITDCVESCGSLTCGCPLFGTGCTFYRYYAMEMKEDNFEVFSCSSWYPWFNVTVSITTHNHTSTKVVELQKGHQIDMDDIKISLRKADLEFLKLFPANQYFIQNDQQVAWISEEGKIETELYTCISNEECFLKSDACTCKPADSTVHCMCKNQAELQDNWNSNKLPTLIGDHIFYPHPEHTVLAEVAADIEVLVETKNLPTAALAYVSSCSITNATISGRNSKEGALVRIFCTTLFGTAVAHAKCSSRNFDVKCSQNGSWTYHRWITNDIVINENCLLTCPANNVKFVIEGHLNQIDYHPEWNNIHGHGEGNVNWQATWTTFSSMFTHMSDRVTYLAIAVAAIMLIVLAAK